MSVTQMWRLGVVTAFVGLASILLLFFLDWHFVSPSNPLFRLFDLLGGMTLVERTLGLAYVVQLANVKVIALITICFSVSISSFQMRCGSSQPIVKTGELRPLPVIVTAFLLFFWSLLGPFTLCVMDGDSSHCGYPVHIFKFSILLGTIGLLALTAPMFTAFFWASWRTSVDE